MYHINKHLVTTPIKITNLSDGSDLINLELIENESTLYFVDNLNLVSNTYTNEYYSYIENELIISNNSNEIIYDIYTLEQSYNNQAPIISLNPNSTISKEVMKFYCILPEDIPNELETEYKVTFRINNNYYCNKFTTIYETEIVNAPTIKYSLMENEESTTPYEYVITLNILSAYDYENLIVDFVSFYTYQGIDNYKSYFEIVENLSTIKIYSDFYERFYLGYKINKYYYWWLYYVSGNIDDEFEVRCIAFEEKVLPENSFISPAQTLLYSMAPTPTPTMTPIPIPTPSPEPTPQETSTPIINSTPVITITNIETKSSIPFWVWIALPIALIGALVMIFVFRKNGNQK